MAVTAKRLISGSELTGSLATYYTAPANTRAVIKKLTLTNKSVGALTVDLHLVPSGGTADDTNQLLDAESVAAGECLEITQAENQVIETGGFIRALASSAAEITIICSGVEIT